MKSNGAVALFVKTPGFSPIKTRLAVSLGSERAEQFHWLAAQATASLIKRAEQVVQLQGYYAVAEEIATIDRIWQDLPCRWQGDGGLGERMRRVYEDLIQRHDYVILIGADCPQMTVADLECAAHWLMHEEQARFAFGPSYDGGFWLFGGNCCLPSNFWTEVEYSTTETGAQFLDAVKQWGDVKTVIELQDADEPVDLYAVHNALKALVSPIPEQIRLQRFLYGLTSELSILEEALNA